MFKDKILYTTSLICILLFSVMGEKKAPQKKRSATDQLKESGAGY
jgi:hypothetical protein